MSDGLYKHITEYLYGLEYSTQDLGNCRRKFSQFFDGTRPLNIGKQTNSDAFCEMILEMWDSNQRFRERFMKDRKDKKMQKDYDLVCNQLKELQIEIEEYKHIAHDKFNKEIQKSIEDMQPYKELLLQNKLLKDEAHDVPYLRDQNLRLQNTIDAHGGVRAEIELEQKDKYNKITANEKKRLQTEYEKKLKEHVRDDEKFAIKSLKETMKQKDEKIKSLESEVKKWKSLAVA